MLPLPVPVPLRTPIWVLLSLHTSQECWLVGDVPQTRRCLLLPAGMLDNRHQPLIEKFAFVVIAEWYGCELEPTERYLPSDVTALLAPMVPVAVFMLVDALEYISGVAFSPLAVRSVSGAAPVPLMCHTPT